MMMIYLCGQVPGGVIDVWDAAVACLLLSHAFMRYLVQHDSKKSGNYCCDTASAPNTGVLVLTTCCSLDFREEGFLAFWKGNGVNIIRIFPYR
jgi:hypothetical protein